MYLKEEWRRKVTRTSPSHIPVLPKITLDDLLPAARKKVLKMYHSRDWEMCYNCERKGHEYILKKCAGCGAVPGQRALYCSRKCQHEDWSTHKAFCAKSVMAVQEAMDAGVPMALWRNINKLCHKRNEGMELILGWVFNQALMHSTSPNLEKEYLSINFHSENSGKGAIYVESFQLRPMTEAAWPSSMLPPPGNQIGLVHIYVDQMLQHSKFLKLECSTDPKSYVPQWPWAFATIIAMQNHNAELAQMRLSFLLAYLEVLVKAKKRDVLQFTAPGLGDGKDWALYDFDKWQEIFGDFIEV